MNFALAALILIQASLFASQPAHADEGEGLACGKTVQGEQSYCSVEEIIKMLDFVRAANHEAEKLKASPNWQDTERAAGRSIVVIGGVWLATSAVALTNDSVGFWLWLHLSSLGYATVATGGILVGAPVAIVGGIILALTPTKIPKHEAFFDFLATDNGLSELLLMNNEEVVNLVGRNPEIGNHLMKVALVIAHFNK